MQIDLTQAANLQVANRDALEVRLGGRTAWKHPLADTLRGHPGIAFDFLNQQALRTIEGQKYVGPLLQMPSGLVFSRASTAGRWPKSGPYEMVASGMPRFDHDPYSRAPLGVRMEGPRTNLLTQSEFATGITSYSRGFATAVSDIEGGRTGVRLDNSAGTTYIYKSAPAVTGPSVFSVFIEMEDGNPPTFTNPSQSGPGNTFTLPQFNSTPTTYTVTRVGTKLWRVSAVRNVDFAGGNLGVVQYDSNDQRRIKITGYQLEAGAYVSSYVVTTTAAVFRASERLYYDMPDPAASGFTLALRLRAPAVADANGSMIFMLWNGVSSTNRFQALGSTSSILTQGLGTFGSSPVSLFSGAFSPNAEERLAFSVSAGGVIKIARNGGSIVTGALTGAMPAGMTRLDLMTFGGSIPWFGTCYQAAIIPGTPFNDNELKGLLAA